MGGAQQASAQLFQVGGEFGGAADGVGEAEADAEDTFVQEPQPKPWVVSAVFRNDSGTWHEILHRTTSTRSRRRGTPDRPPPYRAGRCNAGRSRQRQVQAS